MRAFPAPLLSRKRHPLRQRGHSTVPEAGRFLQAVDITEVSASTERDMETLQPPFRACRCRNRARFPARRSAKESGRLWPLSLMFLLGMGMASGRINCPSRCSCQYLEVNCTGQQLQEFPAAIPLDTRQLILAANNVSYLPAVELSFLADLVYLDCRKNLLGDDLDFTFIGVAKLVYLDLSFNNLTQVTFSTFSHLLSLVVLKISDNPNLVAIKKDAFANNTWLRHLDVSRTGLKFLDTSTVRDLPNLRFLGLSDNLWHCNCSFLDFITWMTESNIHFPDADNITCYTPEGLRALKMPAAEAQLHFNCLTQLYKQDYIFLCLIGFCIFFAGTVAAWLAGVCAVIYAVHASKGDEEEEDDTVT